MKKRCRMMPKPTLVPTITKESHHDGYIDVENKADEEK
jgi:hypothetical protein